MDYYDPLYEFDAPRLYDFGKDKDEDTQDHWFGIFYSQTHLFAISNYTYLQNGLMLEIQYTPLYIVTDYQLKVNWTYWRLYWIYCRHTFEVC
jgi:hypothetical protein